MEADHEDEDDHEDDHGHGRPPPSPSPSPSSSSSSWSASSAVGLVGLISGGNSNALSSSKNVVIFPSNPSNGKGP